MLEEIDTLWRTAPLRREKPSPVDEVRSVMAVFDETSTRPCPVSTAASNDILQARTPGPRPHREALRAGRLLGRRRTANGIRRHGGRHAQGLSDRQEHVLWGLERTTQRVGRGLTLDASHPAQ